MRAEIAGEASGQPDRIDHAAQTIDRSSRGGDGLRGSVRLDGQRQRRLAGGQRRGEQRRDRDISLANGNEMARRIGVVLDVQEIGEGQEPREIIRIRLRCKICGRPRAVYRKFGICRICFRDMASNGLIPGVKKASW